MRTTLDIQHTGTLGDENRHKMGFDKDSVTQLMGVLTDLYSDKEGAVIREYISNAIDSHRAAGNTDPVRVFRPGRLDSTFVVRDFGVGLTVEQVIKEYAMYGYSSKRDSDEQVGMLGLGCKSGLTYTSQFTVVARKDGREAVVLVTRDAEGCGVVQIINKSDTTEPNGVEIKIPVKQHMNFNAKIKTFAYYSEPGSLLVDDVVPECIWTNPDVNHLDEDVIVIPGGTEDMIVMGGVAYPIMDEYAPLRKDYYVRDSVVARVPIGSINFTPSREALMYTKRTKETLDTLKEFVRTNLLRAAQGDVAAAITPQGALARAMAWKPTLTTLDPIKWPNRWSRHTLSPFTWNGHTVPLHEVEDVAPERETQYDAAGNPIEVPDTGPKMWILASHNDSRKSNLRSGTYPIDYKSRLFSPGHNVALVTGFEGQNLTPLVRMRLTKWADEKYGMDTTQYSNRVTFFVYSGNDVPCIWWEGIDTVPYSDIVKIELEKAKRKPKPKRDEWTFRVLVNNNGWFGERMLTEDERTGRILISTVEQPHRLNDCWSEVRQVYGAGGILPGVVIRVAKPSLVKFMVKFPQARLLEKAIVADALAFKKTVTPAEWHVFYTRGQVHTTGLTALDPKKIMDPDLASVVAVYKGTRRSVAAQLALWDTLYLACRVAEHHQRWCYLPDGRLGVNDLGLGRMQDRYPMVKYIDSCKLTEDEKRRRVRRRIDGTTRVEDPSPDAIKMMHDYVNGLFLLNNKRAAEFKVWSARVGLRGRRMKVRYVGKQERSVQRAMVVSEKRTIQRQNYDGLSMARNARARQQWGTSTQTGAAREAEDRNMRLQKIATIIAQHHLTISTTQPNN